MEKTYGSDPRGKKFISLAAFLLTIVLLAVLNVARLYVSDKYPQYLPDMTPFTSLPEKIITGIMITLAAVYFVITVLVLPMWYRTFTYTIRDDRIISRTGLISRTVRVMKLDAVQHVSLIRLPASDYTGFNFIIVNAMGGNMVLMFISSKECREILGIIEGRVYSRAPQKYAYGKEIYSGKYSPQHDHGVFSTPYDSYSDEDQLTFEEIGTRTISFSEQGDERS